MVGRRKMTEIKAFHTHAHTLMTTLALPKCQGPFSKRPYKSLQMMGMQ
jgi:hypothetical protein